MKQSFHSTVEFIHTYHKKAKNLIPTLHGGAIFGPPYQGASQLKWEVLVWSNLHITLVTWVPTMTKIQKMFQNVNSV